RRHTRSKRDWSSDVCSSDLLSKSCSLSHQEWPKSRQDNQRHGRGSESHQSAGDKKTAHDLLAESSQVPAERLFHPRESSAHARYSRLRMLEIDYLTRLFGGSAWPHQVGAWSLVLNRLELTLRPEE